MKKDDFEEPAGQVQYIIKDTAAALKMKKEETKDSAARYKAVVAREREAQKMELAKLKLQMSAKESASKHIAVFGPLYLLLLCGSFIASIKYIPPTEISVVSSILTLLITMIGANLRSIVAGETESGAKVVEKPKNKS